MKFVAITILTLFLGSCTNTAKHSEITSKTHSSIFVLPVEKVEWQKLNPARGDKSPQAATLWGDRRGPVPTGFLAKFVDGFSSPPHIHNATYRAVVIAGQIHNDDPQAERMWMPAGSFWTQPKGEVHITAAKGPENIALVEIDSGPYLVLSKEEKFDSGERPINIDPSNIIWQYPIGFSRSGTSPKIAYLWGSIYTNESNGTFLKLPVGFKGNIISKSNEFRVVVIQGEINHEAYPSLQLKMGSYFSSMKDTKHALTTQTETILYIRTKGEYQVKSSH